MRTNAMHMVAALLGILFCAVQTAIACTIFTVSNGSEVMFGGNEDQTPNGTFIVVDNKDKMREKEVGVTIVDDKASILSYGLDTKWCQIAFLTGKEFAILRQICSKATNETKTLLAFEIINSIISKGGSIKIHEPNSMSMVEIDCMKDIKNENFNC